MKNLVGWVMFSVCTVAGLGAGTTDASVKNEVRFTGEYFFVNQVDVQPVLKRTAAPNYPSSSRRDGLGGTADIAFLVSAKGVPEQVQVMSATNAEFGEAAQEAVRQWRFKPGSKDGKPVRTALMQTVTFQLND